MLRWAGSDSPLCHSPGPLLLETAPQVEPLISGPRLYPGRELVDPYLPAGLSINPALEWLGVVREREEWAGHR
jgi:hypothetical protein